MEGVTFQFYIGDTYSRYFTIENYQSEISEVYFSVKKSFNDEKTVLQKTLEDGITLTEETYDESGNIKSRTYNLTIEATDTETMKPEKEYPFDIEIVTPTNGIPIKNTIISGTVVLTNATTRYYNEKE